MTHVIYARNVNDALYAGLSHLHQQGIETNSRNGRVLVAPGPVVTVYERPDERVLFSSLRDANPFFHFFESLWMLAGRDDLEFPAHFAANIASFSDDGKTVAGAYGHRWRNKFGYDQLDMIINELKANPDSRRCVLSMWNPMLENCGHGADRGDLWLAMNGGKDVPCNTQAYFDTIGGKLNMTVTNRSNDIIWGCYGANAVHFSMLHEYVTHMVGIELGVYRQFSNNFHMYLDRPDTERMRGYFVEDYYLLGTQLQSRVRATPIMGLENPSRAMWVRDMDVFFFNWTKDGFSLYAGLFYTNFWGFVALPMLKAHAAYKRGDFAKAFKELSYCEAEDWKLACEQWLRRREEKRNAKA